MVAIAAHLLRAEPRSKPIHAAREVARRVMGTLLGRGRSSLLTLNDHLLRDIGLTRMNVRGLACASAGERRSDRAFWKGSPARRTVLPVTAPPKYCAMQQSLWKRSLAMLAYENGLEGVHIPDWDAQQRLIAQARQMRSEAWADTVDTMFGAPWQWLREHVVRPLRVRARRRAEIRALATLDPRLLADIGLGAADVQALQMGQIGLEDLSARRRTRRTPAAIVDFPATPVRSIPLTPTQRAA